MSKFKRGDKVVWRKEDVEGTVVDILPSYGSVNIYEVEVVDPESRMKAVVLADDDDLILWSRRDYWGKSECECGLKGKTVPKRAHYKYCPLYEKED